MIQIIKTTTMSTTIMMIMMMNTMMLMNILWNLIETKQINQMKQMITNLTFEALLAHWDKGRTNFSGGKFRHPGLRLDHRFLDHLLKVLFCSTYLFTGSHFCGCIHGHNLVTLGLPQSHPGEKNGITQRLHLSPLSVRYYLPLTRNET